jgi:hypothetical protein
MQETLLTMVETRVHAFARGRRLSPSALATLAIAAGIVLILVQLPWNLSYVWPGYILTALILYAWLGLTAYLGARFRRLAPPVLIAGSTPLSMWGFWVFFGAGDFTPLIPMAICFWAVVRSFNATQRETGG